MNKEKRFSLFALALLLLALPLFALANSWGLSGPLLSGVSQTHLWDAYSSLAEAGPFAILGNRYHNALFFLDDVGTMHALTLAVYQPDDHAPTPQLRLDKGGQRLTIAYGEGERYRFERVGGQMLLESAQIGSFHVSMDGHPSDPEGFSGYVGKDADGEVYAGHSFPLTRFNIRLFPRSTDALRARALMHAKLDSGAQCLDFPLGSVDWVYSPLGWGSRLTPDKKGTIPVYSAPYAGAWRAAKGKASVGLSGELWLLNTLCNEEGESWACIRYFVSTRTQRIGYVRSSDLDLAPAAPQEDTPGSSFTRVCVQATADTFLTDDPDVSQFPQVALPRGTRLLCKGLYNDDYAYVALHVDGQDRPAEQGALLWGFVPLRDLRPIWGDVRADVMAELEGYWQFTAGGNQAEEYLLLQPDGRYIGASYNFQETSFLDDPRDDGIHTGTWSIHAYDSSENLYWDKPSLELVLIRDDNGFTNIKGLSLDETSFTLSFSEGSGGYCPVGVAPEGDAEADANG